MLRTTFDNDTFTPHFGAMHLVRGYRISGRKAPPPVLRTPIEEIVYVTPHFVTTFLVRGYHISGRKAPPPVLRTILRIDVVNVCVTVMVVRKNVSQHPRGARYGSRVRDERSEGEVPGICYISQDAVWQTGRDSRVY